MSEWSEITVTFEEELSFRNHIHKMCKLKEKGVPIVGYVFLKLDPAYEVRSEQHSNSLDTVIKWRLNRNEESNAR